MSELNTFFDSLPNNTDDVVFDISKDLDHEVSESAPSKIIKEAPSQEEEPKDDTDVPFHKNPKVQRYIDRQVRKALDSQEKPTTGNQREISNVDKETGPTADWLMAYGDSEESRKAWNVQQHLMQKAIIQAKEEALNEFQSKIQQEKLAEQQFEEFINTSLESIEDTYDVDITSNSPSAKKARTEFLELVRKLSPKDEYGNITNYADFNEVFDIYKEKKEKPTSETTNVKKALADRSMAKSSEARPYNPNSPKTPLGFDSIQSLLGL